MADGLNDARAMRITEVMTDFRVHGHRINALVGNNPNDRTIGSLVMNQCKAEITTLLARPFDSGPNLQVPGGNSETIKAQLNRVLVDAAARRHRAHSILLKATVSRRNVDQRRQVTGGRPAGPEHQRSLQQLDSALRMDIVAITDQRVFDELKRLDTASGHWTAEMPSLSQTMAVLRTM